MAELPKGITKEVRRGGSGVLELLLIDFDKEGSSGYIRIQQPTNPVSIAQLVISDGAPEMALFESTELLMGHNALEELRDCAAADDSRISVHTDVDLGLIADLHPEAKLHFAGSDTHADKKVEGWITNTKRDSDWWRSKRNREWTMTEKTLDDDEEDSEADDVADIIEYIPGEEFEAGCSYIIDEQIPDSVFTVATHLASIGHPVMVISRSPPQRISDDFGLPISVCRWLSEREVEGVRTVNPGLEEIRRECDQFLWGSSRAVIILDGVEYLSGIHGFSRLIGMLRNLFDGIQTSNNMVLIPADFDVWDQRERSLLLRECDQISAGTIGEWAQRPAVVEGHRFCQETESLSIPEPQRIDIVSEAEGEFKDAATRLLSTVEQTQDSPTKDESNSGASSAQFTQPETSFSAASLLDEMRSEVEPEPISSDDTTSNDEPLESTVTADDEEGDFALPSWATAPSANMDDESTTTPQENASTLDVDAPDSSDITSEEIVETEVVEDADSSEPEVEPEYARPNQPTVNYRSKQKRRVSVPQKPDILQFEKASMHYAAANSKQFEGQLVDSGYEAIDRSVTALNYKKDAFREVGEWETNEERNWEVLETRGMSAAVDNSRSLRHGVKSSKTSSISGVNTRQWGAAVVSASEEAPTAITPDLVTNPLARESAIRIQKSKTLTQMLVGSELEALYADRKQMVKRSGIDLKILERINSLADKGHPIRQLVDRIEANSKEGLKLLTELEKKSVMVNDLINRINIQENRSVIDSTVAVKYRAQLIQFEQIKKIESMLNDFEG
ncbi:MAG TPA: DUF835 domain-containing protein [Candidatus Poseidoniales archaeon]|nr:DUF835 domain-containing protein [Candidatus Poseidoniales archaeon]HIA25673.1 DUF835 domain-containing protein [Candidatus Poseidoniales archaeon]HIB23110.1 DUF835 domain-containing protein [Candidatus Poseidoniales archaeon]HIB41477.1 DUF835 domain-containing protein [Candidatus Poseidoniales archaeon]HIN45611.1 DUF835 domain-containing protein [Candidatus Poseidoniales archaeon]